MAEEELLELFEKASKAAKKACVVEDVGEGPTVVDACEEMRCMDALKAISAVNISTALLLSTQVINNKEVCNDNARWEVGKRLRKLTKHSSMKISKSAQDLLHEWRKLVSIEANTFNTKKPTPKEQPSNLNSANVSSLLPKTKVTHIKSTKVNQIKMEVKVTKTMAPKARTLVSTSTISSNSTRECTTMETSFGPIPKALGDSSRDKIREMMVESLAKVFKEATRDELENVNLINVVDVAVALENAMFAKLGLSKGREKAKYRSIMFNIKDDKNPDFRRRILLGKIKPEAIVTMTTDDMASDHRKKETKEIKAKALFECERGILAVASTDQFKCHKCHQRKTTYFQMQTRSVDEPMTTFITCLNCNAHWKF